LLEKIEPDEWPGTGTGLGWGKVLCIWPRLIFLFYNIFSNSINQTEIRLCRLFTSCVYYWAYTCLPKRICHSAERNVFWPILLWGAGSMRPSMQPPSSEEANFPPTVYTTLLLLLLRLACNRRHYSSHSRYTWILLRALTFSADSDRMTLPFGNCRCDILLGASPWDAASRNSPDYIPQDNVPWKPAWKWWPHCNSKEPDSPSQQDISPKKNLLKPACWFRLCVCWVIQIYCCNCKL